MSGKVHTCIVIVLACAGLILTIGCGGKKQEGAQGQMDTTNAFPEDTAVLSDTASSEKTLEDVEQFLDTKPQNNAVSAAPGEFVENGRYTIQISSSRFERSSQKLVDNLKEQSIPAYLAEVENPTADLLGTYYRVRIGYFGGVSSARSYGATLEGMGYDWWVDNRSNDNSGSGESGAMEPAPAASSPSSDMGFGTSSYGSTGSMEATSSSMPASTPSSTPASSPAPSTGTSTSAPMDFGTTSSGSATDDWGSSTDTSGAGWQ